MRFSIPALLLVSSTVLVLLPILLGRESPFLVFLAVGAGLMQLFTGGLVFGSLARQSISGARRGRCQERAGLVVPIRALQVVLHHEWVLVEGSLTCPECKRTEGEGHGADCQWGRSLATLSRILARHQARISTR